MLPGRSAGVQMRPVATEAERSATASASTAPRATLEQGGASFGPPDFSAAVERVEAAVVGISAVKIVSVATDNADDDEQTLADLLRERGIPLAQSKPLRIALRDEGCGIIVGREGYILTAAHIVDDAAVVTVELRDGRKLPGHIVGIDLPSDVAVLKIEATDLPAATLGESRRLRPGTWVAAIGSPFGLKRSVAVGVVSALNRTLPGDDTYMPFIQTDLPLNPGDSGGPLIDAHGEVLGINSQIAMGDAGAAGVSFAIPGEIARSIEGEIIRAGRVERGDLAMGFQDVGVELARAFGRSSSSGALVHTIEPGGAAARANLRVGDIVVELDGRAVGGARELASALAAHRPGSTAVLGIWRAHRLLRVPVRLAQAEPPAPKTGSPADSIPDEFSVRELTSKERRALATSGRLIVTGVSAQAAAAGLEIGDILLGSPDVSLQSVEELSRALTERSGVLALLVEHEGVRAFIALPLASQPRQAQSEHRHGP